jgi:hypothetical protein
MMDLRTLHSEAMDLAERSMIARAQGKDEAAKKHLTEALRKEEMAARLAVEKGVPEPTRTILLKSAAHLAVDAGEIRLAERLIGTALAGDPPEELAEELRSAFEEIWFHRHLDLRGVELHSNDLQMVMVGDAIAPGMVASDQFIKRVESFQSLIYRTSESDQGIEYRERGDPRATFSNKGEIKRFEQIQSFECNPDIVHAMLGVWNEAGELAQVAPGVLLNKPEALANADLEMADLLWFIALWCEGRGFDLETLMRMVIAKLRARHGEKFDSEKMDDANRDPDAENRAAENARNAQ